MGRRLSRREFLVRSAAYTAAAALSPGVAGAAPRRRPNLLFVFPDEMRQQAMGFLGQDPVVTPNLDRMAREGLVLPNATSSYPVCSPYRAMLLSGKYPHANGVIGNCTPDSHKLGIELKEDERCLPDVLKDAGYACGYIGKWHLDSARPPYIPDDGPKWWDSFVPRHRRHGFDFWHAYNCYDDHFRPHYWTSSAGLNEQLEVRKWSAKHETDVAVEFLRNRGGKQRDPDKPFALVVSHNPPHMPFDKVPKNYVDRYKGKTPEDLLVRGNAVVKPGTPQYRHVKNYFAAVTGVDEQFGRMLACLDEEGLTDNTIVVFTSDHGEMMGSQGIMHKQQIYEESFPVPFLIRWPGRIKPGRDRLHLATPDLMPTLLGLMGLADAVPGDVEGRDHSGVLLGSAGPRPDFTPYYRIPPRRPGEGRRGLRTDRYTFMLERVGRKTSATLFDRKRDPWQLRDVADGKRSVVRSLTRRLEAWLKKTNDPWVTA